MPESPDVQAIKTTITFYELKLVQEKERLESAYSVVHQIEATIDRLKGVLETLRLDADIESAAGPYVGMKSAPEAIRLYLTNNPPALLDRMMEDLLDGGFAPGFGDLRNRLRVALGRMAKKGEIEVSRGLWSLVPVSRKMMRAYSGAIMKLLANSPGVIFSAQELVNYILTKEHSERDRRLLRNAVDSLEAAKEITRVIDGWTFYDRNTKETSPSATVIDASSHDPQPSTSGLTKT